MREMLFWPLLLEGCESDRMREDSMLPWNKPASWEHRRKVDAIVHGDHIIDLLYTISKKRVKL
jgi:hypothetical protein